MSVDKNSYEYKMNYNPHGKGPRWHDVNHLTPEVQKKHEDIFGKKKPWWEIRDEKNGN